MGVPVSFQTGVFVFSSYILRSGVLLLVSEETAFFFIVAAHLYSHKHCISVLISSPAFDICRLCEDSYANRCEVISSCGFDLHFFPFIFISWRLITLQYCSGSCHTLTWISLRYISTPHPEPPSHLPFHPIPLGLPSAPGPSTCLMHSFLIFLNGSF